MQPCLRYCVTYGTFCVTYGTVKPNSHNTSIILVDLKDKRARVDQGDDIEGDDQGDDQGDDPVIVEESGDNYSFLNEPSYSTHSISKNSFSSIKL